MLDIADVAGYLLDRELLSPRAVVDGGLHVVDASLVGRVFLVTAEGERSLVVKTGHGSDAAGVAHEAAVLGRLRSGDHGLAWCLPPLLAYDAAAGVLVLEATPGARDLGAHHRRGRFSVALARQAGRALALLHEVPPDGLSGLPTRADPGWRRGMHRPDLAAVHGASAAALDVIARVQRSDELCGWLDEIDVARRRDAVVHGDVRWANLLALPRRWTRLQLVDWEMAGLGDPAEDVGAFLGEYLLAWVGSIPGLDPHRPLLAPPRPRFPLERMRPALGAFWDVYARRRAAAAGDPSRLLRRATRFAALRLLTAALEQAELLQDPSASVDNAVHLSYAVLRRPEEAATRLLGLRASWGAA